jgi:predicted O-methyltransferase YrrM
MAVVAKDDVKNIACELRTTHLKGRSMKYAVLNLPCESDTALNYGSSRISLLRHPAYACLGLRPLQAQHTAAEHAAFKRWAADRRSIVEIGVAEGVSALAMRESMMPDGTLYLIDPFHLSRYPALNFMKHAARRAIGSCKQGSVVWIEKFSQDAVRTWNHSIDLLVIDGDHSEAAVERDWNDWSRFVPVGGAVLFHDACLFEGGWTKPEYGPVKIVNRLFRNDANPEWKIAGEVHSVMVVERIHRS